ncbi:MAG: hypothetical protein VCG02_03310 [Verrucomicrobiota bacterium]
MVFTDNPQLVIISTLEGNAKHLVGVIFCITRPASRNPLALVKNLNICSHPLAPGTLNKVNENPLGFPARIAVKPRAVIPDNTNNEKNRNKRRISLRAVAR